MQWHPIATYLLKLWLQADYDTSPEESVSELPRRADIVLAHRGQTRPSYGGVWSRLRAVNVLEFKGPTDVCEAEDLEKLFHVGCGIAYRRNEKRREHKQALLPPGQITFWYLAPQLPEAFLREAHERQPFSFQDSGIWKAKVWGHEVYLVAYHDLPAYEEDSVPLHLLRQPGDHPPRRVAELVAGNEELKRRYGIWFTTLHRNLWKEIGEMPEVIPAEWIQWSEVLKNVNCAPLIEAIDLKDFIAVRGLDQVIQTAGLNQVIHTAGLEQIIKTAGIDEVAAALKHMSVAEQEELRRRLEQPPS